MDIIIFMIVTVFGLVLTLLGLYYKEIGFFAFILNMFNFGSLVTDGLSEVIGYNATSGLPISRTFDLGVIAIVPMLFCVINFVVLFSYYR